MPSIPKLIGHIQERKKICRKQSFSLHDYANIHHWENEINGRKKRMARILAVD
jgi:hypothetical protein